jgi:hypothetical protein
VAARGRGLCRGRKRLGPGARNGQKFAGEKGAPVKILVPQLCPGSRKLLAPPLTLHTIGCTTRCPAGCKTGCIVCTQLKNSTQWYSKLDNVLQIVAGRDVTITDAFRLGRFSPDRIRPILAKLSSAWDRHSSWQI